MFAESMIETSWAQRTRRSWTTLTSFGLQAAVIALLLLIPVLQTVGVPLGRTLPTPISWGAPPPARPPIREHVTAVNQSNLADNKLITPPSIPRHVAMISETVPPPQVSYNTGPGVEGGTGNGSPDGVWNSIETMRPAVVLPTPPPTVRAFRTSSILEGSLIRRVQPIYPPLARTARIQGSVVLAAVISKEGTMEHVQLISGHPMLVQAAVAAVSQWRYKPYILNGEAIEVETQITVNFILGNQ
jgi:periplasmic protein TonB